MTALPSNEQEQRAKWDLLLLDIETRTEQLRQLSGVDHEIKLEELRQLKTYEGKRLVMTAGAAIFAAGAAFIKLFGF